MEESPYNFKLINEDEGRQTFLMKYQGREVGTIETTKDGGKKVRLRNGIEWSGAFNGDMWDFLLSQEPFKQCQ